MASDLMILAKEIDYSRLVGKPFVMSEKIDGVPGVFSYEGRPKTRQGEDILSCDHIGREVSMVLIKEELKHLHIVGELHLPGQPFKVSSGAVRRNKPNEDIKLAIWDCYFDDDFSLGFSERRQRAWPALKELAQHACIDLLDINYVSPQDNPDDIKTIVLNWYDTLKGMQPYPVEGVMCRLLNMPYTFGRSWGMMRYVPHPTLDLRVCGFKEATANKRMCWMGEWHDKGQGLNAVGKILCEYKGEIIGVGPGCMTHTERSYYFDRPDLLDGKIIKVKYKHDPSYKALRQPTFVCMRPDKTTPDH